MQGGDVSRLLLTGRMHRGDGDWDELALLDMSVVIGIALAFVLGSAKKG